MLRNIRLILAIIFLGCITLLFADFTGATHAWLGWMAKIQFLPALLALHAGIVVFLLLLTLVFGRVYCSVICPLGVFQDVIAWFGKRKKKNRYSYSPARSVLRYSVLALFVIALLAGFSSFAALLAPYSSYGRIASNFFAPLYRWGNNLLAYLAERADSYAFYETEVWIKSLPTFLIAAVTLIVLLILAWKNGRTYCNTICPVGTVLGFVARFAWLKPVIDPSKCIGCSLCARNCKAACIDFKQHRIDYSRCVSCMDCIGKCHKGAIRYTHPAAAAHKAAPATAQPAAQTTDKAAAPEANGRRRFLASSLLAATALALKAQEKKVDGGLAVIEDKKVPARSQHILPPGALSARHFAQHCTACQLCVSACPNGVLRPSTDLKRFMQPEMSYERGYCRPECTRCADVCPTGAIRPITQADKSATQIGHAVWIKANCIPLTDGVQCGNCARHCPSGAIQMIPSQPGNPDAPRIPAINTERCIGCGACENLCPARPFSAIYVESNEMHRSI
ncbi:MAG: 4Fe-4S binding protein [Bacteroidaceae bacterium]|jgi:ferredoxin